MAETWKKLAFFDEVATTFLGLSDTPGAYITPGAYYKVNAGGTAVEEGLVAGAASGLATLDASSKVAQDPKLHAASHQDGGGDEISVAALSGLLADGQTPLPHAASHKNGAADEILLNEFGEPTAAVPFDGQQANDLVVHSVANAAARPTPVVAKICHQQDDEHLYICTVAV